MAATGADGKPYSAAEIQAQKAGVQNMQLQLLSFSPERLGVAFLLWMHQVSCGGVMRMRPGELRQTDITFGSFYGTRPALIRQELEQMMLTHHWRWPQLEGAQDVYLHAAWVHAELIRIHPVWDGR